MNTKSYLDIYIVGVGGQGVLTIAEIITEASYKKGLPVNFYPTKGMAQRGGFVKAQLRLGRVEYCPSIPQQGADVLASMELSEALKAVRYAKQGADFVLYGLKWEPAAVMLGKAPYPSVETVKGEIEKAGARAIYVAPDKLPEYGGAPVHDNLYLLGVMLGGTRLGDFFTEEEISATVAGRWPKAAESNLVALRAGLAAAGR